MEFKTCILDFNQLGMCCPRYWEADSRVIFFLAGSLVVSVPVFIFYFLIFFLSMTSPCVY